METKKMYDVLLFGQMMKDRIVLQNETHRATGGAVYYAGFAVQRSGVRVAIVTKLAKNDDELLDELRESGVEVFAVYDAVTSSIEITYPGEQPDKRTAHFPCVAQPFTMADIPDVRAEIVHLCPLLRGEISLAMVRKMREQARLLSLDAQGFMRDKTEDGAMRLTDWEEKAAGLALVDILKVDDVEAEILTGESDLRKAVESLAAYGPREIVVTYKDGMIVYTDGIVYEAPFTSRNFKGRTGRGDTTMGAYLARRLSHSPEEACQFAGALVSLKMEEHGPFRKTLQDVNQRLRESYRDAV